MECVEAASSQSSESVMDCVTTSEIDFLSLPAEVIELVCQKPCLTHRDICHLAQVSSRLRDIFFANDIWKCKLQQKWPDLFISYEPLERYPWYEEFLTCYKCGIRVREIIAGMSAKHFQDDEISNQGFDEFVMLQKDHPRGGRFITDELMAIIHHKDVHKNLTHKYYAEKVVRFVLHNDLREDWEHFLALPAEKQSLEKGCLLIAQWCQPAEQISQMSISAHLNAITSRVCRYLHARVPNHPMHKSMENVPHYAEIHDNLWAPEHCREVLVALNHVMFEELRFTGNEENYYDPYNSYINKVLERRLGIPITLCVVYMSVARRLGVICYPVNFPTHFLIKWLEHPDLSGSEQYTYIDVFRNGKFMSENECRIPSIPGMGLINIVQETYSVIPPVKVFERMARNLVNIGRQQGQIGDGLLCLRNAVELLLTICPADIELRLLLARLYIHLRVNLTEVMSMLEELVVTSNTNQAMIAYLIGKANKHICDQQEEVRPAPITPKLRSQHAEVKFAIGQVMKHKRYEYSCVIYGWDPQCEASPEWIVQMGVHLLPKKQFQTFYNVLVEDGSNRYAAQENLEVSEEPVIITHPELGKYLQEHCGTYYMPNEEKAQEYPEDTEMYVIRNQITSQQR